jgi:3-oxoacyl-[acyl-carrier-protein] synthase II
VTLSAYKANFGHTFGAAGSIELIMALLSMRDKVAPKIINLEKPVVTGLKLPMENVPISGKFTIKNALGFGGINVSMLFGKVHAF